METAYTASPVSTVKEAELARKLSGIGYQLHDCKNWDAVDQADSSSIILARTQWQQRGTTWRKLSDDQKSDLTEDSVILLILEHPSLIKRPILRRKSDWLIGFDESACRCTILIT